MCAIRMHEWVCVGVCVYVAELYYGAMEEVKHFVFDIYVRARVSGGYIHHIIHMFRLPLAERHSNNQGHYHYCERII